jgi:dipeptidyl aminopeptidase/acylaminoacyl peptidase
MFDMVRAKGSPTEYMLFEGEQHGFRKAESSKRSLEGELYFYSKIFKSLLGPNGAGKGSFLL